MWAGVLEVESIMECGIRLRAGCRDWIRFWEAHLVDFMSLRLRFPSLFRLYVQPIASTGECFVRCGNKVVWDLRFRRDLMDREVRDLVFFACFA